MKPYFLSLAVGLLVGVIYSVLGTRSPAPPAIALLGLLGMSLGEQVLPPVGDQSPCGRRAKHLRQPCLWPPAGQYRRKQRRGMMISRRQTVLGSAAAIVPFVAGKGTARMTSTDIIITNARVTTLDRENPEATAITKLGDWSAAIAEQAHFGLHPAPFLAALTIAVELLGPALILSGRQVWLGAGMVGVFTALAAVKANAFWLMPVGPARVMATNAFVEHIGLVGGLALAAILARLQNART
jgi:XapX domain-containing protein